MMCEVNCTNCRVDAFKHGLCPDDFCEKHKALGTEDDFIRTLQRKTGKWIPCSDKIPSEAQECWITAKDGTVCQGMFTRQYGERRDSGFICNNGFAWLNTVVAWMPYDMPEPYQKEGE